MSFYRRLCTIHSRREKYNNIIGTQRQTETGNKDERNKQKHENVVARVGDIVDLVTRTREGHVTGQANIKSRVTSGLTSSTVKTRPREDSYREITQNPPQTLGGRKAPPTESV